MSLHCTEKIKSLHCGYPNRKILTKIFVKVSNIVVSVVQKSFQTVKKFIQFSSLQRDTDNLYGIFVNVENVP